MGTTATQDDPAAAVAALKAQGAPDEAIHAYLTQRYGAPVASTGPDAMVTGLHAAYQKGLLPGIEQGKSADEASALPTPAQAVASNVGQGLTAVASGVPGGKLALSGLRYLGDKLPYGPTEGFHQAQNAVNTDANEYAKANPVSAFALRVAPTALAGGFLPASGLKAGALLGSTDELLNNDPTSGIPGRLLRAAGGGIVGGATGGLTEAALTGVRSALAPNASKAITDLQAARSAADQSSIGPSYATAEGQATRYYGNLAQRQAAVKAGMARATGDAPLALPAPGQSAVARQAAQEGFAGHDFTNGPAPTLEQAAAHDFTSTTPPGEPFQSNGLHQTDFTQERPVQLQAANDVKVRRSSGGVLPSSPADNDYIRESLAFSRARTAADATGPTGANAVADALNHPGIAPYANMIRNSEIGAKLNDADVGKEAYRLMGELQGKKLTIGSNGESTPASDFQVRNLGALKDQLRTALAQVAPDFPEAVATHAEMSQPITAFRQGYKAAGQTLGGPVSAKALGIPEKDPAALLTRTVPSLSPAQAESMTQGALSRTRATLGATRNPFKSVGTASRVTPLVQGLDAQSGQSLPSAIQRAILGLSQSAVTP